MKVYNRMQKFAAVVALPSWCASYCKAAFIYYWKDFICILCLYQRLFLGMRAVDRLLFVDCGGDFLHKIHFRSCFIGCCYLGSYLCCFKAFLNVLWLYCCRSTR